MRSLRSHLIRLYMKRFVSKDFLETQPIRIQRRVLERTMKLVPRLRGAETRTEFIEGTPACWVSACGKSSGAVIVYLHGGGYCIGSMRSYQRFAQHLSRACQAEVLLVDYRLAPEHPFPAALDDSLGVVRSLVNRSGFPAENFIVGGDSAGGGLALATALALRDANELLPKALFCLSPWTDLTFSGASIKSNARSDFVISESWLRSMAERYVPDAAQRDLPLVSPLMAELSGLPPLFIQVGTKEILLDDSLRLAERAGQAGVEVELEQWRKMWHVWHLSAGLMPESGKALRQLGKFIQRHVASTAFSSSVSN